MRKRGVAFYQDEDESLNEDLAVTPGVYYPRKSKQFQFVAFYCNIGGLRKKNEVK